MTKQERYQRSLDVRSAAANRIPLAAIPDQTPNQDEHDVPGLAGNFSKGLPHDADGLVQPAAFQKLVDAMSSGDPAAFEAISLGVEGEPLSGKRPLTNPQAGLAYDLEGPDSHALALAPAPSLKSDEIAAEMAELYWMALLRDVPFGRYETNADAHAAAASLSAYGDAFKGPRDASGAVTPKTLFRGVFPGDEVGPYLSQFLLVGSGTLLSGDEKDGAAAAGEVADGYIQYGTLRIDQRQRTALAGRDYLTRFSDAGPAPRRENWLDIQNGVVRFKDRLDVTAAEARDFEPQRVFLRNLRDLATWVHYDALYEGYLNAALWLLSIGAPSNPGNPYGDFHKQAPFATFGGPHLLSLVTEVATRALKVVWYQKWAVHRRLRPEEYGGRVHLQKLGKRDFGLSGKLLHDDDLLGRIFAHNQAQNGGDEGSYLLPMAFPEGCPTHPAYGAGHATVAGACVTVLKAWFKGEEKLPLRPLMALEAGDRLYLASNEALTIEGELNKLAANVAIGRNGAGVHWRSDYRESVLLGERIALGILQEQRATYNELRPAPGAALRPWCFRGFSGEQLSIGENAAGPPCPA